LAVEAGTVGMVPKVPSLREENARQGFFERGDFEAVLAHIDDDEGRALLVRAVALMIGVDWHRPETLACNAQTLARLR